VVGCTRVSAGCDHCYAAAMSHRLAAMHQPDYVGLTSLNGKGERHFNGTVRSLPHKLDTPLKWKNPRMVFVNSMSDLFHKDVPFDFIDKVFAVMGITPQHTYQILTKRPEIAQRYMNDLIRGERKIGDAMRLIGQEGIANRLVLCQSFGVKPMSGEDGQPDYKPFPNVWLGTSIEDQESAHERVRYLLDCPAAVRFLSVEPLLGPIDLTTVYWGTLDPDIPDLTRYIHVNALDNSNEHRIDWVIIGCESRPGKRLGRLSVDGDVDPLQWHMWMGSIIDQCEAAGVKVFVKQIPDGDKVTTDLERFPRHLRIREMPREAVEV